MRFSLPYSKSLKPVAQKWNGRGWHCAAVDDDRVKEVIAAGLSSGLSFQVRPPGIFTIVYGQSDPERTEDAKSDAGFQAQELARAKLRAA